MLNIVASNRTPSVSFADTSLKEGGKGVRWVTEPGSAPVDCLGP